jgi:uncharacterized cupin superfamily protein
MRHTNIVNEKDLEWNVQKTGNRFESKRKSLSSAAGGERLGCSLYEIPPGKTAWPYHYHLSNEEAIFILSGCGTLRIDGGEEPISGGDYVSLPAGKTPHQLINDSDDLLRYICFSTMIEPDVTVHPDSGKIGVFAGSAPGGPKEKRTLQKYFKSSSETDYWDGEET